MTTLMSPPKPYLSTQLSNGWTDFDAAIGQNNVTPPGKAVLDAIFGNSPYLTRLVLSDPAFALDLLGSGADAARYRDILDEVLDTLSTTAPLMETTAEVMAALRLAKNRAALIIAAADIADIWTVEEITNYLSELAERTLDLSVAHLIKQAMVKGELMAPNGLSGESLANHPATPDITKGCGYFVLGMGKLGARELNYSSDVDLIVFFDNQVIRYTGKRDPQDCFVKITRELVRMMQEQTVDGYVFRTDLRLRPDPGATAVAISVEAAEIYYQSIGLNWERAAMIKARPVAGDREAGYGFLNRIRSFVWRKHLDFAAVEDIHAIKGMIHRHHGHRDIAVLGQDVKLGRGGIREIEFFCQIQQLIAGGRERELQIPQTLGALEALKKLGKIDQQTEDELTNAYRFLRRVEHRIQMIDDEQTHSVPQQQDGADHLGTFLGFPDRHSFEAAFLGYLHMVKRHYDTLLEPQAAPSSAADEDGLLSASFDAADPALLETLQRLGIKEGNRVAQIIEGWGFGRHRALRTPRSRAILKKIMPRLMDALAETPDPDTTFLKFDEFLSKLPAGVQILSLFQANPWLLDVIAEIIGIAPALADELARRPALLDAVLHPTFFAKLPDDQALVASLQSLLETAKDYQDILDISRIWANEQRFHVGVQLLRATITADEAGKAFTKIADAVVIVLLDKVSQEFAIKHGTLPGSRFVALAMGKLGGAEMTFTSDLDMIFIYDAPDGVQSDGAKQLTAGHYYARLTQAYINALTAMTGEGRLYEVDMLLRPSGNAGPIAVPLAAFEHYQQNEAWTWEHMALTRARAVAGDSSLAADVTKVIHTVLTTPRDQVKLLRDVAHMRERLRNEFGTDNIWSLKHCRGGIVDLEFIWQYLELAHAAANPSILAAHTIDALKQLGQHGYLPASQCDDLLPAYTMLSSVQTMLRLCTGNDFSAEDAPVGLKSALAKITGSVDFDALIDDLKHAQDCISACYNTVVAAPAAALPAPESNDL